MRERCPVHGRVHSQQEVHTLTRFKPDGAGGFVARPREELRFFVVAWGRDETFGSREEAWEAYCPASAPEMRI